MFAFKTGGMTCGCIGEKGNWDTPDPEPFKNGADSISMLRLRGPWPAESPARLGSCKQHLGWGTLLPTEDCSVWQKRQWPKGQTP